MSMFCLTPYLGGYVARLFFVKPNRPAIVKIFTAFIIFTVLYALDVHEIPNEPLTILFLIKDRQRTLQEIRAALKSTEFHYSKSQL